MGRNIAARLERMPHINGEALAQFFGESHVETIRQILENPTYNNNQQNYYPTQPTINGQPHAQKPTITHVQQQDPSQQVAQQNSQKLTKKLAGSNLTPNDIKKLQQYIADSSLNPHLQSAGFLPHAKNSFAQLLDELLEEQKNKLSVEIIDPKKLAESIKTTRAQRIADIEQLTHVDTTKIDNLFAGNNLEKTILENMSAISCPACFEFFKQEHRHGQVERIILKSANPQQSCGHAVCSTCAPECHNRCPLCRAAIDQQDLNQKLNNQFAPTR
jgi:hypothetical protein